tara:strand:- start:160 stop:420 length:261 start_codon:yes stop_codon:yes gene_type:complete
MPIYEYECTDCNEVFESMQTMEMRNAPVYEPCPKCSKEGFIEKYVGKPLVAERNRLMGIGKKLPQDFRDRMKTISKNHPGNSLKLR